MPKSMFDINMFCANRKCASTINSIKNETEGNSQCHIFYGTATMSKAMRYSQYIRTTKPCIYRNANAEVVATSILYQFIYGDVETVKSLLTSGSIDDINAYDKSSWNSLSRASYDGDIEKVRILIDAGAKINTIDNNGWSALTWARVKTNDEIIRLLIENGAIDTGEIIS